MYIRSFRKADQIRRFTIADTSARGWEVRDEQNSRVIRRAHYTDWHRVERARMAFAIEAISLANAGWIEVSYSTKR